ncbi:hypothetical protein HK099_000110 [Clydaea vesicula]|uniref:Uncharacterized protein n=1 Tax=Clydaea vesicula TaxID=447962 RepID=A0AAD5TVS6_9FUNG|nr:hypothetical protein HK099_000110 [Clydaea vesicula]
MVYDPAVQRLQRLHPEYFHFKSLNINLLKEETQISKKKKFKLITMTLIETNKNKKLKNDEIVNNGELQISKNPSGIVDSKKEENNECNSKEDIINLKHVMKRMKPKTGNDNLSLENKNLLIQKRLGILQNELDGLNQDIFENNLFIQVLSERKICLEQKDLKIKEFLREYLVETLKKVYQTELVEEPAQHAAFLPSIEINNDKKIEVALNLILDKLKVFAVDLKFEEEINENLNELELKKNSPELKNKKENEKRLPTNEMKLSTTMPDINRCTTVTVNSEKFKPFQKKLNLDCKLLGFELFGNCKLESKLAGSFIKIDGDESFYSSCVTIAQNKKRLTLENFASSRLPLKKQELLLPSIFSEIKMSVGRTLTKKKEAPLTSFPSCTGYDETPKLSHLKFNDEREFKKKVSKKTLKVIKDQKLREQKNYNLKAVLSNG